ncbi:hypothetical protein ACIRQQ_31310 [Streptomyces fuscichromogenes]|uniref:hypothetical protein n=1 Tax=Streptomyces fuscichromogenes TaxID=1324013 RepID=UPI0038175FA9
MRPDRRAHRRTAVVAADTTAAADADLAELPDSALRIENPVPVRPVRSRALEELNARVRAEIEHRLLSRAALSA